MSKLVYLSGPVIGRSYGNATCWRGKATDYFGRYSIDCLSPLRGMEELEMDVILKDADEESILFNQKTITNRCRWDIAASDLIFANLLSSRAVSIGTVGELFWADILGKPIVMVMERGNPHQHPMIREISWVITDNFEVGLRAAINILLPDGCGK